MAYIPKKALQRFKASVPKFQQIFQIAKDRDVNESDTVSIITDVLAEVFGYDKYLEVTSEFMIRGTYCDLAIKVDTTVQFLIEVKAIGIDLKEAHLRQVIAYAANHGVQWVVLTNGKEWRLYRMRFEKPINYDLIATFDFLELDIKKESDIELLFIISKEGLKKNTRDEFFEKVKCVNRFTIAGMILTEPVLGVIRRELRKISSSIRVDVAEIESIIRGEVLKRDLIEGQEAKDAQKIIEQCMKKSERKKTVRTTKTIQETAPKQPNISLPSS